MVGISRETYERSDIETVVDGVGIMWLNEKCRRRINMQKLTNRKITNIF